MTSPVLRDTLPVMFSQTINDRFSVIEPYVRRGSVLMMGCVDSRTVPHDGHKRVHRPNPLFHRTAEANADIVAVDIDREGVAVLNSMGQNITCADVDHMDFGRQFDAIIASEIIPRLENPGQFLRNMRKHIKDTGILIVSAPNPFYAAQTWKIWRYGHPLVHEDHLNWQDPTTLDQLLRRTGFDPFEGYWVQPRPLIFKTWKRLLRPYFSHTFLRIARPLSIK